MTETVLKELEYISSVFRELSTERKDCILNTARSLIEIQNNINFSVHNSAVLHSEKEKKLN